MGSNLGFPCNFQVLYTTANPSAPALRGGSGYGCCWTFTPTSTQIWYVDKPLFFPRSSNNQYEKINKRCFPEVCFHFYYCCFCCCYSAPKMKNNSHILSSHFLTFPSFQRFPHYFCQKSFCFAYFIFYLTTTFPFILAKYSRNSSSSRFNKVKTCCFRLDGLSRKK